MDNTYKEIDCLMDDFLEDILEATDEEILEEAREDGIDVEKEINHMRNLYAQSKLSVAKMIVSNSRSSIATQSNTKLAKVISIEKARALMNCVAEKNPDAYESTMAARFGEEIPDDDVYGWLEDMIAAGHISEDNLLDDYE